MKCKICDKPITDKEYGRPTFNGYINHESCVEKRIKKKEHDRLIKEMENQPKTFWDRFFE